MQDHDVLKFVFDTFAELIALHVAAATAAERVRSVLAKHDEETLQGVTSSNLSQGRILQDQLTVETAVGGQQKIKECSDRCCYQRHRAQR